MPGGSPPAKPSTGQEVPGPSTWPLLSHVARSQPGGVRRFLCSPQPPQQPPLSGWGSPSARELQAGVCLHRPRQAPTPFQCPRRGGRARADHPGVGTCPNPAVTWGSNTWPRRGSLWLLQSPSSRGHSSSTTGETNPPALCCWPCPKETPSAGPKLSPAPMGLALLAARPPSTSSSSGFG